MQSVHGNWLTTAQLAVASTVSSTQIVSLLLMPRSLRGVVAGMHTKGTNKGMV